jgi:hypothetical protein
MKLKSTLIALAGMFLLASGCSTTQTTTAGKPDKNFYVFLCFGQSNMEGFPGIEDQDKTGVDERFKMLAAVNFPAQNRTSNNWYTATPPLCRPGTGLCPADFFGRTLVSNLPPKIKVGVVNVAVAGCKIEMFDKENFQAYASTAPAYMVNTIKAYSGNPYAHLVEMGKLAQQQGVIKGILVHQGESNAGDRDWPKKVKAIYDNLVKDLNLDPKKTPLLAGEVVNADQKGACAGFNTSILAKLPQTVPNSYIVSSKGCLGRQDHLHFTPAGYRELGSRYAMTMLPLLGYKAPVKAESAPAQ